MRKTTIILVLVTLCFLFEAKSQSFPSVNDGKDCFPAHWMRMNGSFNQVGMSDAIVLNDNTSTIEKARLQAIQRALYLYSLRLGGNVAIYSGYEENVYFVDSLVFTTALLNFSYKIEDEYLSPSGELFVLLNIDTNSRSTNIIEFETSFYIHSDEDDFAWYEYCLNITDNFSGNNHEWKITKKDNAKIYKEVILWHSTNKMIQKIYSTSDMSTYGVKCSECKSIVGGYFRVYGSIWIELFNSLADYFNTFRMSSFFELSAIDVYIESDDVYSDINSYNKQISSLLQLYYVFPLAIVKNNKLNIDWISNLVKK